MWNYKSENIQSSGYEDVVDIFKSKYTKEIFNKQDDLGKDIMVEEVFNIYRSKNIFPITYYNDKGIHNEIIKCINKDVTFDGNVLDLKFNQGSSLCKYLFPNLHKVECKGASNNSMHDRFYDDHKLSRAIRLSLSIKSGVTPSQLRGALELIGGNVATNFKPMNAKALYEYYVPKNGVIYDFACGFGGRMLGALSSKNNYTYIGVEPCSETIENLNTLGKHIENVTNRSNSYELHKLGSEEFNPSVGGFADFAFSSPPYFNLEVYSNEDTQCYNKFNNIDEWFDGYVRKTIKNIHHILKSNGKYAVNIADFNIGKKQIKLVDRWIEISKEEGFNHINSIDMKLNKRVGNGHTNDKKEGIFVFEKII